jgi:hypothetical protein
LREQARMYGAATAAAGRVVLSTWLDRVALVTAEVNTMRNQVAST